MANNVYIGSRYVPIFDGDWDATKVYEPLTIVNYNGGSYTSKQDVPAGTLPTNTDYWALTGNYNGQIANLQQQINTIENEISELSNDDILIIFDSYGTTYGNPSGDNTTIVSVMSELTNRNIRTFNVSGGGFVRDTGNGTFYTNLVTYLNTLTANDKSKISTVIVAAGRNDWTATTSQIKSAMETFYNYCESNLPNLKEKIFGYIANGDDNSTHGTKNQQYACYMALYNSCLELGISWLQNVDCVLHDYSLLNSDGVHPTSDGKKELGRAIIQALKGEYNCSRPIEVLTITPVSGVTISTTGSTNIVGQMINNISSIRMGTYIVATLSSAIASSLVNIPLFTFDNGYIKYPYGYVDLPVFVAYKKNDTITPLGGKVYLDHDGIVKWNGYVPSGNRADNISEILLLGIGDICINGAEG